MKLKTSNSESALSLIEMMVTVALLAVIILGLVAMFDQTRKAFTGSIVNVDYQDAGRVTLEMIARELQQMAPTQPAVLFANAANPANDFTNLVNFYSDVEPARNPAYAAWPTALGDVMTPTMNRLLFITHFNQTWSAVGYRLDPNTAGTGVGTLYQYRASAPVGTIGTFMGALTNDFLNNTNLAPAGPLNRVIDNVVNFRVRAFTPNGVLITGSTNNILAQTNASPAGGDLGYSYVFAGNAVPAYVEIELSILETRTADRYRSMAGNNATTYLTNHVGQVHVFRQRITIPGVDQTAYP